jgi:8-oxo-dGTP pyrophosphatase MutT (NUDIX family)
MALHTLYRKTMRVLVGCVQFGRHHLWSLTRPDVEGAHAIALTPAGRIILVKLSYARGWHLPGGGRKAGESAEQNVLRELREEIGMTAHDAPRLAFEVDEQLDNRRDLASVFIVRNVIYRANPWSIEIERVIEADPADLPSDISRRARRWIDSVSL